LFSRRLSVVAFVAGAGVLLLAGCAKAALTTNDVSSALVVHAPSDTVVGDSAHLTATVNLPKSRSDKVIIAVQSSTGSEAWTTLKKNTKRGPRASLSITLPVKTAGSVKYRTTISLVGAKKPLLSSNVSTVTAVDIKSLVRTFYYDRTNAFKKDAASGMAFDQASNGAVFNDSGAAWTKYEGEAIAAQDFEATVPDLNTVSPDPAWKMVATSCTDAATSPPPGRTYVVTTDISSTWNGLPSSSKQDVHVTLRDGKLLQYQAPCQ
jgi:hypothetical protein